MTTFEHITHNVMEQDDGSPLLKALTNSGIDNIYDLLCLKEQQIDALEYDDSGTMRLLDSGSKNEVTHFKAYVWHRRLHGTPIGTNYLSVMPEEYDDFFIPFVHYCDILFDVLNDIKRMGIEIQK